MYMYMYTYIYIYIYTHMYLQRGTKLNYLQLVPVALFVKAS